METEVTSPLRPATFEDEWDDPMMAQIKRWESEDRAEFGCSEEARVWWDRVQSAAPISGEISRSPRLPKWQGYKLIRLPW